MYTAYQNIIVSDSLKFQQRGQNDKLKVTLHYFSFWVSILFYQPNYQNNCCILESPLEFWFSSLENSDNEDFFFKLSSFSGMLLVHVSFIIKSWKKKPNQIYYYYAYSQGTIIFIEILNFIKWLRWQSQKLFVASAE